MSCVKIECYSSELLITFRYAGSSIQNASEQIVLFITFLLQISLFIQLHKETLTELVLEIQTTLSQ